MTLHVMPVTKSYISIETGKRVMGESITVRIKNAKLSDKEKSLIATITRRIIDLYYEISAEIRIQ